MVRTLSFAISCGIFSAIAVSQPPSAPGKIYGDIAGGKDDRIPMRSTEYPWTTIGKIYFDKADKEDELAPGHCTGGLIDSDIAIANAHCVLDKKGNLRTNIRFLPNYQDGKYRHISYAHLIWKGKPSSYADWAVLKLKTPLGKRYGSLGTLEKSAEQLQADEWKGMFILAGYSQNFMNAITAGLHLGCSIYDYNLDGWLHDCDTSGGSSGAPIFAYIKDKPYVVAINYAEYPGQGENVAVPIATARDGIESAKNKKNAPPKTTVQLCSNHGRSVTAAVAYYSDSWTTEGWFPINAGTCREIELPKNYSGKLYAYAASSEGIEWKGSQNMCVEADSFVHSNADTSCRNGRWAKFAQFEVEYREFNEVIFK